jgi:ABC-type oligopeptide transport system ATPase subunit
MNPIQPNDEALVQATDLRKWFPVQKGWLDQALARRVDNVKAVDGVSFKIIKGEVLGLAG